jgi:ATP-binding cassette subfamily B protein IrtA
MYDILTFRRLLMYNIYYFDYQNDFVFKMGGTGKMESERKIGMKRLWELATIEKGLVHASCLLSVLSTLASFIPFAAVYFIIKELLDSSGNTTLLDGAKLINYGWLAFTGVFLTVFLNFAGLCCSHIGAFKTLYRVRLQFITHLAKLPLGFHSTNSVGKMRKIIDENIEKLEVFIAHQLPDMAGSFAAPVILLVFLFIFDFRLGLASLVPVVLAYYVQTRSFGKTKSNQFMKLYQDALEEMNSASVEYIRGIYVIKAFNQTVFSFKKFRETIRVYTKFCLEYTNNFRQIMTVFFVLINNVYLFLIPAGILIFSGTNGGKSFAMTFIFYLILSGSFSSLFMKLMYVSSMSNEIVDGIERMDKITDVKPLPETLNPKPLNGHDIAFENVSFSYVNSKENEALTSVTFKAKQGEMTALVGASGSGKSTIGHLTARFFDVSEGRITIGNVDIRDVSPEELMENISFVFQDIFLFKQSIYENIIMGNKKAGREEVIKAAKAAQCHDFIMELPMKYETVIGTKSVHLSGGERQRIALARAILKDAPIIILDEATAFSDPENEMKIQTALGELIKNKTAVVIAHRLSTIQNADNIIVLDRGRIAEEGKHRELMEKKGKYYKMWDNYTKALTWHLVKEGDE